MDWLVLKWGLFLTTVIGSTAHTWSEVQLSTCDVPMASAFFTLCCYTRNVPQGASINFYNKMDGTNFTLIGRVKPACILVNMSDNSAFDIGSHACRKEGGLDVYKLELDVGYSGSVGIQWGCGFYGNFSSFMLTENQVLTKFHGNILNRRNKSGFLNWTLSDPSTNPTVVEVYGPSGNKLMHVIDQNITYYQDGFRFTGDISSGNVSVMVIVVAASFNGTYVCVYNNTSGLVQREGLTLIIPDRPKMPVLTASKPIEIMTNVRSGHMYCYSKSQYAAPPYYKPTLEYVWILPDDFDDPNFSSVSVNDSAVYIPRINCALLTSLPVYCQARERKFSSFYSSPMNLSSFCDSSQNEDGSDDSLGFAEIFIIGFFSGCMAMTATLAAVWICKRQGLFKKYRRRWNRACKCSSCCQSSSDTDSDLDLSSLHLSFNQEDGIRGFPFSIRSQLEELDNPVGLEDGLARREDEIAVQEAIERLAIEDSQLAEQNRQRRASGESELSTIVGDNRDVSQDADRDMLEGAVGGEPAPNFQLTQLNDTSHLRAVEQLLSELNQHLQRNIVRLEVNRDNIVQHLLQLYTDSNIAVSHVEVKMVGERGMDCGGVTDDMYTTFWYHAQEVYFLGCETVVPHLPINRWNTEEAYYRTFGRILSHTTAIMKALPIPLCKSSIIVLIFNTTNVDKQTVMEDFLFFLDPADRSLVTTAINNFGTLTKEQIEEIQNIFTRYDYPAVVQEQTFNEHLTQLARNTVCIRPKPLLDLMREGIPESHFNHFWCLLNISYLDVLFRALRPTPDRVISRLKTAMAADALTQMQRRAFGFLQDFIQELGQPELETFLQFLTGRKSTPRQPIEVCFTDEAGFNRAPKAHTCSNLLELPETYENYETFKTEFKHLLAADEAFTMSMA